jgi:hypothetical protein
MEILITIALVLVLIKAFGGLVGGVIALLAIGAILEKTILKTHREESSNIEYY